MRMMAMSTMAAAMVFGGGCVHTDVHPVPADAPVAAGPKVDEELGATITSDQRWILSDARSVADLQGTTFGEREITEFWTRKGWRLTRREERYLTDINTLTKAGVVTRVSRWATCPFAPVYQTLKTVNVLGQTIPPFHEFYLDVDAGSDKLELGTPRFKRTGSYSEDHEDGHVDAPSAH